MRFSISVLISAVIVSLAGFASTSHATPGDVVDSLKTPGLASTGTAFDGSRIWQADRLSDSLYALDPANGTVVASLPSPGFVPQGLAWDGKMLWVVDREESRILRVDVETGNTVWAIPSPFASPTGLAWDGNYLWIADDKDDIVAQISTDDGTTIIEVPAPSGSPTGLAWWNGYLWCGDRMDDRIYLMDPAHDGEVIFGLDAPGAHVQGLAADGEYLYAADYQSDRIFRMVQVDDNPIYRYDERTLNMKMTYELRNYGPGDVPSMDVYIAVPDDLPNQELISKPMFNPEPVEILYDRWEQPVARFHFEHPELAARNRVTMETTVKLHAVRHYIYPDKVGKMKEIPKEIRKQYLVDEDKYRINDPIIQKAVEEAVGDETNPYWIMRRIHRYIRDRMEYELYGGWNVAPRVIDRGNGSCSEYTFVFISMCRAASLPARYVGSIVVRGDDASTDEVFHRWSQVYLPGYGWVNVDPQGGDKPEPWKVGDSIGCLSNRFLITTTSGGASEYLGWGYNYNEHWTGHGPVKIHTEAVAEWSPVP